MREYASAVRRVRYEPFMLVCVVSVRACSFFFGVSF